MELKNLNGLAESISVFDSAKEQNITINGNISDRWKAIVNKRTEEPVQIVGSNYKIIQHSDAVQAVVEVLGERNIQVNGMLNNNGSRIRGSLRFIENGEPIKDDANGLQIGIRFLNSYDKSSSFRLEMYAFRMICQNGMALGNAMNNVKEITMHTGQEKTVETLKETVNEFIDNVINSCDKLQQYINNAMEDSVIYTDAMKMFEKYMKIKKHRMAIAELMNLDVIEIEDKNTGKKLLHYQPKETFKEFTRWDFYNMITDYATHNKLSINIENHLQRIAQKVLVPKK